MGGVKDTLPFLEDAAAQLGGRTLKALPGDMEVLAPEIQIARRIVFFTYSNIGGLTASEMGLIQGDPMLLAKTIFVYGGL